VQIVFQSDFTYLLYGSYLDYAEHINFPKSDRRQYLFQKIDWFAAWTDLMKCTDKPIGHFLWFLIFLYLSNCEFWHDGVANEIVIFISENQKFVYFCKVMKDVAFKMKGYITYF
jgi:hypothetical protein